MKNWVGDYSLKKPANRLQLNSLQFQSRYGRLSKSVIINIVLLGRIKEVSFNYSDSCLDSASQLYTEKMDF